MSDQHPGNAGPVPADSTPTGTVPVVAGTTPPSSSSAAPKSTSSAGSGPERDWTWEVSDKVESVVGAVRDKTTVPITKISRIIVFGLVAAVVAVIALVLTLIALVRVIDVYLPFEPYGRRVWVGYAGLGAIFLLAGAFSWSKRTRKPQETAT